MKKIIKLSLYGLSGSGKSTAGKIFRRLFRRRYPEARVINANVAQPLHRIQDYCYRQFGLPNTGQDGQLLQFMAGHFANHLGSACIRRVAKQLQQNSGQILALNTDCRNNAFADLKQAGFRFVQIQAENRLRRQRLEVRGDRTKFNLDAAVESIDQITPDYTIRNNRDLKSLRSELEGLLDKLI